MSDATKAILRAYEEGQPALLIHGRSLHDLVLDQEGKMRPLVEALRRDFLVTHGLHLVTYSMANGLDWDASRIEDARDRSTVERLLRAQNLIGVASDEPADVVRVVRGIASVARQPGGDARWTDGREVRLGFLLEFAEHLAPNTTGGGSMSDAQVVTVELAHTMAQSLALRRSGNLIMFHGREGLVDCLLSGALHRVHLKQPGRAEKAAFVAAAVTLYPQATFADGLTADHASNLTAFTPNRGVEQLIRAAHRAKRPITARDLTAQKSQDVVALSEDTLSVLDPARVAGARLIGRNVSVPAALLTQLAGRLRAGDARMPANILLSGAPGTGKTDLAILTGQAAGVTAYALHSPKRGIVGETERLARLQQDLLAQFTPAVAFVDEITESMPVQRSDFDGDSGASRAVMASLLTSLSDESRRGRSLLIATTNCPWRMSAAMRSRFVFIPVLQPLREDLPGIIVATAKRIDPAASLDSTDPRIRAAGDIFYNKGANPRHIREALTNLLMFEESLTPEAVERAASHLEGVTDRASAIYADLWAIRACASRQFLPWHAAPSEYPFPEHLRGVVNEQTGEVIVSDMDRRIEEYRPHASV